MVDYHFTVLQCVYLSLEVIEVLIEAYPNAVNVTDTERNLPLHTACLRGATFEVIQLLLDRFVGDKQHHNGLRIADNNECLPIHYYARSQSARAKTLQHLLKLYPGGIHVLDGTAGRLPLHHARLLFLPSHTFEVIHLLVKSAPYTVIQKCSDGRIPIEHAWRLRHRNVEVETYLLERQNEAVNAIKEASLCGRCNMQLGLPDLVIASVWNFAKPDLSTRPMQRREGCIG
jgi:hypothetical protein